MPLHRILHLPDLMKLVLDKWPEHTANQFMATADDRIRLELQTRTVDSSYLAHIHPSADTVHIIIDGEGEYSIGPDTWVPVKAGDVIFSRAGESHGGRGTKPGVPLRYLVLEGPAPEDFCDVDGTPRFTRAPEDGSFRLAANGAILGTNVLLGGPADKPAWVDQLPADAYRDR